MSTIEKRVRRHVIGKPHRFFAVVAPGFEETSRRELEEIGVEGITGVVPGGVEFEGRLESCYRANLGARTITRVLMRFAEFGATGFRELGRKVAALPLELFLPDGANVSFRVTCARSRLYHERAVEEELGRAFASRGFGGGDAAQEIQVRVLDDVVQLSLDTSGPPLYLRGRKAAAVPATLRETLAAAILREAGWPDHDVLIDPMCGAGTFTLEALEMALGRLPNGDREFPFLHWPAFRPAAYEHLRKSMQGERAGPRVIAFDRDPEAVEATRRNLAQAGLSEERVSVTPGDFLTSVDLDHDRALLVLNPPYGKRLAGDAKSLYRRIGEVIRFRYRGAYAVLVPGLEVEKALSLPRTKKILFRNGGLRVAAIFGGPQ